MKLPYLTLSLLIASLPLSAADTAKQRLKDSAEILKEIMAIPDKGIPQDMWFRFQTPDPYDWRSW